jgi:hypothetical protein
MKARSGIFKSKHLLLNEYIEKVSKGDAADKQDLLNFANSYESARGASSDMGESKSVFAKQIV